MKGAELRVEIASAPPDEPLNEGGVHQKLLCWGEQGSPVGIQELLGQCYTGVAGLEVHGGAQPRSWC